MGKIRFVQSDGKFYMLCEEIKTQFKEGFNFKKVTHVTESFFKILSKYNHCYQFVYELLDIPVLSSDWEKRKFFMKDRILMKVLDMSELKKFKNHRRLKVFYNKGLECANPKCNEIGYYLLLTLGTKSKELEIEGYGLHVDVFTKDLKLMTVDHILPKSKGGSFELDNLRPMCYKCNNKLGTSQLY